MITFELHVDVFKTYKGTLVVSREWFKDGKFWSDHYYELFLDLSLIHI